MWAMSVPETGGVSPEPSAGAAPPPATAAGKPPGPREVRLLGLDWNEADAKSAIITVGGTVTGGLLLVLFIGISVILAKQIITLVLFTSIYVIMVAIIFLAHFSERFLGPGRRRKVAIRIRYTALGVIVISLVLNTMAYVGLAAGIK